MSARNATSAIGRSKTPSARACAASKSAQTSCERRSDIAAPKTSRVSGIELRVEPSTGPEPVALDGACRDAEHLGDLLFRHAAEEAELRHLAQALVDPGEPVEG